MSLLKDPLSIGAGRMLIVEAHAHHLQEACAVLSEASRLGFAVVSQSSSGVGGAVAGQSSGATDKIVWTLHRPSSATWAGNVAELQAALQKLLKEGNPPDWRIKVLCA